MSMPKLKPAGKLVLGLLFFGLLFGAYSLFGDKFIPTRETSNPDLSKSEAQEVIKIGVVTWGGYAGGQYFNEGFKPTKESRFYKEYGILVEFKLIDDFAASREAFKTGEIDLLWQTIDAFPTEVNGLAEFSPKVLFQSDWSRGGDAIVVRQGINNTNDLRGKKIAVAPMTPSHTFLLNLLESSGLTSKDVEIIQVANAMDAADLFKKMQVDAAIVWSPDDQDCINSVNGSKILVNTKTASNIIADIFLVKEEFIKEREEDLKHLVEGWFIGAAEINSSDDAKRKAAKILAEGLNQPEDFCYNAINNARLCTHGDNMNFFDVNGTYDGVTGEDLYNRMTIAYTSANFVSGNVPTWREIAYPGIVKSIALSGPIHAAEMNKSFTKSSNDVKAEAISSKKVTISFPTASSTLTDDARYTIDKEFVNIARGFSNAKIRIEGNTDNVGDDASNQRLSEKRAQAVAEYLIQMHSFDRNRIVVVGNGESKPVATNVTEEGRASNRRTDFELISE